MEKYVYVVKKNSDTTEGRGPMILDSIWIDDRIVVADYIDFQPGIMGRTDKWSSKVHGDWTMDRVEVFSNSKEIKEARRFDIAQKALAKLSTIEKEALGLLK